MPSKWYFTEQFEDGLICRHMKIECYFTYETTGKWIVIVLKHHTKKT